ncbi:MAG: MmcQ/YjbR family DNA-binding protein [Candidatus Eisenbacteria bacterium]|nr:MmcQ/YjbR family DNA-binding protein [Candidatus Eisenbacteria bacterium]
MTPATFRRLALSLPEALEFSHMNHPDFRVRGKVFASLGSPEQDHGTVKLTPAQQEAEMAEHPAVFTPAAGAWGRRGYTVVRLRAATAINLRRAMRAAWHNTAPTSLRDQHEVS